MMRLLVLSSHLGEPVTLNRNGLDHEGQYLSDELTFVGLVRKVGGVTNNWANAFIPARELLE